MRPRFLLSFLCWDGGLSGGDRHLLEMASRWSRHVDLVVAAPPQAEETLSSILGEVRFVPLGRARRRGSRSGLSLAAHYLHRAAAVSRHRLPDVDVVLAASHFLPDAAALGAATRSGALGVSYVYHLIETRTRSDPRTIWSRNDERIGLALIRRYAAVVFTSNTETAERLGRRGIRTTMTGVGIDLDAFVPGNAAGRDPRALFLARMARSKGVIDAIDAWSVSSRAVPDARLVMVGDGPERAAAEAYAIRLGLEQSIEWRGFVSEAEKRSELQRARILLAPSHEEGWGISVCEALACAVPVVAYRLPTLDELFGNAYVGVPLGDSDALARAAVELLVDDDLVRELSAVARPTAEQYDLNRIADQELEHILRALRQ